MSNQKRVKDDAKSVVGNTAGSRGSFRSRVQWVNPHLAQDDIQWLKDHANDVAAVCFEFLDGLPIGYNVACKFDQVSNRYTATLFCELPDDPNNGYALSLRGATRIDALYALAYCHMVKTGGTWGAADRDYNSPWG